MTETKFVVFCVESERYALPISEVERILHEVPVTPLPRTPKLLTGVFDLRGSTIPVIDLRRRMEMADRSEEGNFVVTLTDFGRVGLRVDRVEGIVSATDDQIEPPQTAILEDADPFIGGILRSGEDLTVVLLPNEIVPKNLRKKVADHQRSAA